jgi:lipoic acid synthetase
VDADEPRRIAEAVRRLGLAFVVITSVTRDDLADGGAAHFAATVEEIAATTQARVEVLVPDFAGRTESVDTVVASGCAVFGHNLETVPRLYARVRPLAEYDRSLGVLRRASESKASVVVKSGLMLGLGETTAEVERALGDMHEAGCRAVTLGQYLSPRPELLPVVEYLEPERFDEYAGLATSLGFTAVASGSFVRSSYLAEEVWREAVANTIDRGKDL